MLSKLLKYEFRSTYRTYLGVYGVMVLLCAVTGALDHVNQLLGEQMPVWAILLVLTVMFLFAAVIITTVINLKRFYDGMFKDEGYLTHTLPVPAWQNLAAKLIPAVVWTIGTGIMMIISTMLMVMTSASVSGNVWGDFFYAVGQVIANMNWTQVAFLLQFCLLALLTLVCFILQIYASLTLGQLVPKHPVGAAVLIWFVFNLVQSWTQNFMSQILINVSSGFSYMQTAGELLTADAFTHGFWWNVIFYLVWSVLFWVVTQLLLERRLNLN